jgi:hypothetical protein
MTIGRNHPALRAPPDYLGGIKPSLPYGHLSHRERTKTLQSPPFRGGLGWGFYLNKLTTIAPTEAIAVAIPIHAWAVKRSLSALLGTNISAPGFTFG